MKKLTKEQIKSMGDMGGADYARQEAWDIQAAANALSMIASMVSNEVDEPMDMMTLADIMNSLIEFIRGEIKEMETAANATSVMTKSLSTKSATAVIAACRACIKMCQDCPAAEDNTHSACIAACQKCIEACRDYPMTDQRCISAMKTCAEACLACAKVCDVCKAECRACANVCKGDGIAKSLDLSYAKSLGISLPELAVKYVALDEIKGYTFLWGSPKLTDIEMEYFTKDTNFWDESLGKSSRPLTWDHSQDENFKAAPIIGLINDFGDDEIGRWYVAKLDRSHKYRKAIDALIEAGKLGTSSDSAPQYVQRVKTGKSTWLKEWPWFASALTDTPAEPRMIDSLEFYKSLGITFPDASNKAWEWRKLQAAKLKSGI